MSLSDAPFTPTPPSSSPTAELPDELQSAIQQFDADLQTARYAPTDVAATTRFRESRLALANEILGFPQTESENPGVMATLALIAEVIGSGLHDLPATEAEKELLKTCATAGWPGMLAGMLTSPGWRWTEAPPFDRVPNEFWGVYARWAFAPVQSFNQPGDAEAYAEAYLPRLENLARWVERNAGSSAVRAAMQSYLQVTNCIPLYFTQGSLRRHAEARARILTKAIKTDSRDFIAPIALPRYGRPLRIGFVNRHFGSQTETYTTLPTFEHLDPERFETVLFTLHETGSELEQYCRGRAGEFHVLSGELFEQVEKIRMAGLDVLVFGTNLTAVVNEVTRLATHRMAPLQVVNNSSCITSGLPEVDMYVSGDATEITEAAAHFSERLGLLPGPAHAFNYDADAQEPATNPTRADYNLPEDGLVFVSAANYYKLVPEVQHTWAKLLAAQPESHLLVHPFNPNWSDNYPMERFRAEFDAVLQSHGVAPSRLVISDQFFPSRTDVKELLKLGDIYLDTFPFAGVNSLVDPLELGLPTIVWDGETFRSRMAGGLLRSIGLHGLVATDEQGYLDLAWQMANEPDARTACSQRIREAMDATPLFLDPLAASDAFGDLVEKAYDELADVGAKQFARGRHVLRAGPSVEASAKLEEAEQALAAYDPNTALESTRDILRQMPDHAAARRLHARALQEAGRAQRASQYFLASLQGAEDDASLWFDCARALHAADDTAQALAALEASLRIDPGNLDGWAMMADLADAVGSTDIADQARSVAHEISPEDPRFLVTA